MLEEHFSVPYLLAPVIQALEKSTILLLHALPLGYLASKFVGT